MTRIRLSETVNLPAEGIVVLPGEGHQGGDAVNVYVPGVPRPFVFTGEPAAALVAWMNGHLRAPVHNEPAPFTTVDVMKGWEDREAARVFALEGSEAVEHSTAREVRETYVSPEYRAAPSLPPTALNVPDPVRIGGIMHKPSTPGVPTLLDDRLAAFERGEDIFRG